MKLRLQFVAALVLGLCTLASAQEPQVRGNLMGTVIDSAGSVLPGVKVTIMGTFGRKTEVSDQAEPFLFPLLQPGLYNLTFEKQGFKTVAAENVPVRSGKTTSIRIGMNNGNQSETVKVQVEAVIVDTASIAGRIAGGGGLFDYAYVSNRPDPGRPSQPNATFPKTKKDCRQRGGTWDKNGFCYFVETTNDPAVIDTRKTSVEHTTTDRELQNLPVHDVRDVLSLP
jgi:hypothetical protein